MLKLLPDAKKGTLMLKNDHVVFVYVNRAQTEQSLNPVHDRGLGSSQFRLVRFWMRNFWPFQIVFLFYLHEFNFVFCGGISETQQERFLPKTPMQMLSEIRPRESNLCRYQLSITAIYRLSM